MSISVLLVWGIDLFTGNWVKLFMPTATTFEQWQINVLAQNRDKSWNYIVLYLIPLIAVICIKFKIKVYADWYDFWIIFVMMLASFINVHDHYTNGNWRPIWFDMYFFNGAILILFILKIIFHVKEAKSIL